MCSVPMKLWPTSSDSRRAASRAAFAPGENGIAPGDGSSRSPTIAANPVAHDVHVQARLAQHAGCDAWLLAHQPQQQVLGADVVVAEHARASSCASTTTWRARSVKRSNTPRA